MQNRLWISAIILLQASVTALGSDECSLSYKAQKDFENRATKILSDIKFEGKPIGFKSAQIKIKNCHAPKLLRAGIALELEPYHGAKSSPLEYRAPSTLRDKDNSNASPVEMISNNPFLKLAYLNKNSLVHHVGANLEPLLVELYREAKKNLFKESEDPEKEEREERKEKEETSEIEILSYGEDAGFYTISENEKRAGFSTISLANEQELLLPKKAPGKRRIIDIYSPTGRLAQRDLDLFNSDFLALITNYKKDIEEELYARVKEAIEKEKEKIGTDEQEDFQILELIEFKSNINEITPGLEQVSGDQIQLVYPAYKDRLTIKIKIRARITTDLFRKTTNVTLKIKDFKLSELLYLEPMHDGSVELSIPNKPKISAKTDLDVSNDLLNVFISAIETVFDPLTKLLKDEIADAVLKDLRPELDKLIQVNNERYGKDDSFMHPQDDEVSEKQSIIEKIEDKIFGFHIPDATIYYPIPSESISLTWKDLADFDLNDFPDFPSIGLLNDGAIWTGTFLTSLALRYQETNDPNTLARVEKIVGNLDILARVNGEGPLARTAVPEDSRYFKQFVRDDQKLTFRSRLINGKRWHSYQAPRGVSRDQYAGVMTGLINTYLMVNDPAIKEKAKSTYLHLLNYLIKVNWIIDEDREKELFTDEGGTRFPTHYAGNGYHKLIYLMAATKMAPENTQYRSLYKEYLPYAKTLWANIFLSTVNVQDDYYSFNLKHTLLFALGNLNPDKKIAFHIGRGVKVLQNYIGHHMNPYFDAIRLGLAQKLGLDFDYSKMRQDILRDFNSAFYRPMIYNAPSEADIALAKIFYEEVPVEDISGNLLIRTKVTVSPRYRAPNPDFIWQGNPFQRIGSDYGGHKFRGGLTSGLGLHIVYWILRNMELN